jgi:hypothetical protein
MTRGRPFESGNKFGPGRPKGSPNKKSREAQQLFENNSPAIMALAISKCREDPQMLRMLASHIVPRQKVLPIKIGRRWLRGGVYAVDGHDILIPHGRGYQGARRISDGAYGYKLLVLLNIQDAEVWAWAAY